MNNVHTPRYDVGSRARLVCISRRGRSTDRAISNNRQRYRAIGLSRWRAGKTSARRQGGPRHRAPFVSASVDCRRCSSPLAPLCPICFTRVSSRNRVIRETVEWGRGEQNVSRAKNSDLLSARRNSPPFILSITRRHPKASAYNACDRGR